MGNLQRIRFRAGRKDKRLRPLTAGAFCIRRTVCSDFEDSTRRLGEKRNEEVSDSTTLCNNDRAHEFIARSYAGARERLRESRE
jgi:hypothetical protein